VEPLGQILDATFVYDAVADEAQGAGDNGRTALPFRGSRRGFGTAAQTGPKSGGGSGGGCGVKGNIFGVGCGCRADRTAVNAGCLDAREETAVKPFVPTLNSCVTLFVI
jgi:hypothetical protein